MHVFYCQLIYHSDSVINISSLFHQNRRLHQNLTETILVHFFKFLWIHLITRWLTASQCRLTFVLTKYRSGHRVRTDPGKSWNKYVEISRPGKSWKRHGSWKTLKSPGILNYLSWKFYFLVQVSLPREEMHCNTLCILSPLQRRSWLGGVGSSGVWTPWAAQWGPCETLKSGGNFFVKGIEVGVRQPLMTNLPRPPLNLQTCLPAAPLDLVAEKYCTWMCMHISFSSSCC